jgi:hypothetical protein
MGVGRPLSTVPVIVVSALAQRGDALFDVDVRR